MMRKKRRDTTRLYLERTAHRCSNESMVSAFIGMVEGLSTLPLLSSIIAGANSSKRLTLTDLRQEIKYAMYVYHDPEHAEELFRLYVSLGGKLKSIAHICGEVSS